MSFWRWANWCPQLGLWPLLICVAICLGNFNLRKKGQTISKFNRSNMFAQPLTNQFAGVGSRVTAKKGLRPDGVVERRNIQLALRFAR